MKKDQKGFSATLIVLGILVICIVVGVWWYVTNKTKSTVKPAKQNQSTSTSVTRDNTRKEHATQFAANLFNVHLVQKRAVTIDQSGFDSFSRLGTQNAAQDPLTQKDYIFNADQTAMTVGQVTFKLGASCDNKLEGSNGTGLIVGGSTKSVAVAIKLESGLFACESNL